MRQFIADHKAEIIWTVAIIIILLVIGFIILAFVFRWEWTGFFYYTTPKSDTEEFHPGKSLWDVLDLVIIPAVLGVGIWWLNRQQRQSEQNIAREREEERALQNYFDIMKELLLEKDLRNSGEDSEVRSVARVRTLAVLREVNETRKTSVMQFLLEAELIGEDATVSLKGRELEVNQSRNIVNLSRADLSRADLIGANLSRADLSRADLTGADLFDADLREAKLSGADLTGVDLSRADLFGANLIEAELQGADLSWADLRRTDLSWADLSRADLFGADLSEANLQGTDLSETYLSRADLSRADLIGADLSRADLTGADLRGADLRGVNLNEADLSEANLQGTDLIWADLTGADLSEANLIGAKYNSQPYKDEFRITYQPTQWPADFDPVAAEAIDASKEDAKAK